MDPLIPWIVANAAALLLLAGVFAYLHTATGRPALRLWALGYCFAALSQVTSGLDLVLGPSTQALVIMAFGTTVASLLYLKANYAAQDRAVPRLWWLVIATAIASAPALLALGFPNNLVIVPLIAVVASVLVGGGIVALHAEPRAPSAWLAGGAQIALGLHILGYGYVSQHPSLLPWGHLVAILLVVTMAIGLIMGSYEQARGALLQREAELAGARRMEAIGLLAGGVAHDFNNLLTVIIGNLDLAHVSEVPPHVEERLHAVRAAADQATRLTTQLLALGRRSVLVPEPFDLIDATRQSLDMLRRVTPEHIELDAHLPDGPLLVVLDRGSVEQLLLNLVANARDSMPGGGVLTVALAHRTEGGSRVILTVGDTGTGMDAETAARVFEPFFTTKELGHGTGLGLASVHGIVTQLGGTIALESAPGQGTTLTVRLPAPLARGMRVPTPRSAEATTGIRVLVVEDDDAVRRVTQAALVRGGYDVHAVPDGADALRLLDGGERFALIVSDIVMRQIGGIELARRVAVVDPDAAVLLVSGHPLEDFDELPERTTYLSKPYTPEDLRAAAIRALPQRAREVG